MPSRPIRSHATAATLCSALALLALAPRADAENLNIDRAGNRDRSPAERSFRVTAR